MDRCRRSFSGLVAGESSHADAWQLLALALCRMHRFDDAVAALDQAVRLRPADAALANDAGETLRQAGRLQEAERSLKKALSLQPGSAEHYHMVLALQPPRAEVLLALSGVCADLGEYAEAAELARRAESLEPDSNDVIKTLGSLARSRGDDAVAREQFRRLSAQQPSSLPAQLRVATILPAIPSGADEIQQCEEKLLRDIESLRERALDVDGATLHTFGAEAPMAWAYHGLDMRPLKVAYTSLFAEKLMEK